MANKPNINPENIGAGLGELKSRLLFLLFAIFVYRIGTHIPVPGIDPLQLQAFFNQNEGTFADLFNICLLYTSPSPRDMRRSRMPSSA